MMPDNCISIYTDTDICIYICMNSLISIQMPVGVILFFNNFLLSYCILFSLF